MVVDESFKLHIKLSHDKPVKDILKYVVVITWSFVVKTLEKQLRSLSFSNLLDMSSQK